MTSFFLGGRMAEPVNKTKQLERRAARIARQAEIIQLQQERARIDAQIKNLRKRAK